MSQIRLFPLLVLIVLAACTGDDDDVATTSTSTTSTTMVFEVAPPESQAEAYFDALSANEAGEPAVGAVPGSDAALYAEHQAAARDLLGATAARTVVAEGPEFEICDVGAECTTFGSVESDPASGLVTSFSINGVRLAGRIVGAGLVADRDGAVARIASAYRTNDGDVFMRVEVDNTIDVPIEIFGFAAVLDAEVDGAGIEASGVWGNQQFPGGSDGEFLLQFAAAELGGFIRLSGLRGDGLDLSLDLRLPSAA